MFFMNKEAMNGGGKAPTRRLLCQVCLHVSATFSDASRVTKHLRKPIQNFKMLVFCFFPPPNIWSNASFSLCDSGFLPYFTRVIVLLPMVKWWVCTMFWCKTHGKSIKHPSSSTRAATAAAAGDPNSWRSSGIAGRGGERSSRCDETTEWNMSEKNSELEWKKWVFCRCWMVFYFDFWMFTDVFWVFSFLRWWCVIVMMLKLTTGYWLNLVNEFTLARPYIGQGCWQKVI